MGRPIPEFGLLLLVSARPLVSQRRSTCHGCDAAIFRCKARVSSFELLSCLLALLFRPGLEDLPLESGSGVAVDAVLRGVIPAQLCFVDVHPVDTTATQFAVLSKHGVPSVAVAVILVEHPAIRDFLALGVSLRDSGEDPLVDLVPFCSCLSAERAG